MTFKLKVQGGVIYNRIANFRWHEYNLYVMQKYFANVRDLIREYNSQSLQTLLFFITSVKQPSLLELPWIYLGMLDIKEYNSPEDWKTQGDKLLDSEEYNSPEDWKTQGDKLLDSEEYNSPEDWKTQGDKLLDSEKYLEAIDKYNRAIELSPNFYEAWLNRGIVFSHLDRYQEAIHNYQQSIKIARKINNRLQEAISLNCLGNAYYSLANIQEAIYNYQKSLAITQEIGDSFGKGKSWAIWAMLTTLYGTINRRLSSTSKVLDFMSNWINYRI